MTSMLDDLKNRLGRRPFAPFRIVLTTGEAREVTSRYQIAIGRSQFSCYYPKSDRKAILRANQVAAFETLEQASH